MEPRNTTVSLRHRRLEYWNLIRRGKGRRAFWAHAPAADVRAWLPRAIWRRYHKFTVERNPWDKAISLYWWCSRDDEERPSMLEFFETVPQPLISNLCYYTIGGKLVVDQVLRYEKLDEELAGLAELVGLEAPLELPTAKSGVRGDRRPYSEVLGPEEREVISRRCAPEIELLGYHF